MVLNAFLVNFDSNSFSVSSLKIASIFCFNSSAELGKIQHNFSPSLSVWGASTVKLAGTVLSFAVDKREGYIAVELPLKDTYSPQLPA